MIFAVFALFCSKKYKMTKMMAKMWGFLL